MTVHVYVKQGCPYSAGAKRLLDGESPAPGRRVVADPPLR